MQALFLHCRPGFEKDCAAEIVHHADALGLSGRLIARPDTAHVVLIPNRSDDARLVSRIRLDQLVFARQLSLTFGCAQNLPLTDRLSGLLECLPPKHIFSACRLETPDTNEAKSLSAFCRKFAPHLERALSERGQLQPEARRAMQLVITFTDAATAWVGQADPANSSPWPMGIPRLRMPSAAPSRSTLKLLEAWLTLLTEPEREKLLRGGMRAADLGAAPGGWTWQLVQKGMLVTAVDNGRMDANLMSGGMVEHIRGDGFHYRPRKTLDWMVCDMVEKPSRIAELAATWLVEKRCLRVIVNFKLPMKKRFEEWLRIRDTLEARTAAAGLKVMIRAKQLYHDREEITACLLRG